MQAGLLQWFVETLIVAAVGLVGASGVYFVLRAIEKWNRDGALVLNTLITVALLILTWAFLPSLYIFTPVLVATLCGFKFHQKSGGVSKEAGDAFILMMAATLLAPVLDVCVLLLVVAKLPFSLSGYLSSASSPYFYLYLFFVPVPLVPFLLWLRQNSRLRPGIDRHLQAGEDS